MGNSGKVLGTYLSIFFFLFSRTCAFHTCFMCSSLLDIKDEVQEAIINKRAVVALESTIITHGMPHPENLKTAIDVENIVREQVKTKIIYSKSFIDYDTTAVFNFQTIGIHDK